MKHNYKRFLAMVMAVVMIIGMMPLNVFAADAETTTKTVYFKPSTEWYADNAWFAAYVFNNETAQNEWLELKKVEDGIYQTNVSEDYPNIIFVRMNCESSEMSWDAKWTQTNDLTIPTGDENLFTLNGDWATDGTWSHKCIPGEAATCTTDQSCTVCGDELAAALGHSYVDGVCTVCNDEDPDYVAPITGTITEDTVWADGTVVGDVTISGDVTITVNGTVTVTGQITLDSSVVCNVKIVGDGILVSNAASSKALIWSQGISTYTPHTLTIDGITLDGGAVWTGDNYQTLNRGTTNTGRSASGNGAILFLRYSEVTVKNAVIQNQDSRAEKCPAVNLGFGSLTLEKAVVRNNYHSTSRGGAIYMRDNGKLYATDTEFYGNHGSQGGVVGTAGNSAYGSVMDFTNCSFHNNFAPDGAVFHTQDNVGTGYLKLVGCTIKDNSSTGRGLIDSSSYYVPVWMEDTIVIHDGAVYDYFSDENRSFSVSGSTQISGSYDNSRYASPVRIYGKLDSTASIPMNEASVNHLMNKYGYLATATPDIDSHYNHLSVIKNYVVPYEYTCHDLYSITQTDLARVKLYEGNGYTGWVMTDVDGNGMLDAVPVSVDPTTVNVTLTDGFKSVNQTENQDISNVVENVPVCYYEHPGYFFNGWLKEDGTLIKNASSNVILNGGENLTAAWAVARPRVAVTSSASLVQTGKEVTLTATIGNMDAENLAYTYQWYRSGTAVEGATEATYTTTEADAGYYTYKCVVTATDADYNSDTDYATLTTYGTNTYNKSLTVQFTDAPVASDYVAQVKETGVKYESLQEAMNDCANGGTVRLIADIEVDGSDITSVPAATNSNGKYFNPGIFNLVGDVAVTVDLNGHNITYHGHGVAPYTATANKNYYYNEETGAYEVNSCTIAHGLFLTNDGADLTIVDNAGTAAINVYGLASAAYSCSPGSTITIEGGTWNNMGCETCGGTNIFLYASHGGELYIEGGYFAQDLDADGNSYLIVEHGGAYANSVIDYSVSKIEITGGTFAGMNPELAHYFEQTAGNKLVTGATTNVVAEGYYAKDNGDNSWTVLPKPVAKVEVEIMPGVWASTEITKGNWADLVSALGENTNLPVKVTLYEDIELAETLIISGNKTVDLNLNGKTITVSEGMNATPAIRVLADVTVHGGTVNATNGTSTYAFIVGNSTTEGKLTITDGTYEGITTAVSVTKGQLNVSGGYFKASEYDGAHEFTLNCIDANYNDGSAVISLTGGTYYGFDPENNAAEGEGTNFCAQHYVSVDNGDGTWTVMSAVEAGYVCWNVQTGVYYEKVTAGLQAAENGQTVQLLTSTSDGNVLVFPGLTLDLNGFDLTADYLVGFNTANVIDSQNGTGSLITGIEDVVLDEENAMVPVYNGSAYLLTKVGFALRQDADSTDDCFEIDAMAYPVVMEVVELLKNGGADNNIRIAIRLSWDSAKGESYQEFVFTDDVVAAVYGSNNGTFTGYTQRFSMEITGFEGIQNLKARMVILSDTNATYISSNSVDIT